MGNLSRVLHKRKKPFHWCREKMWLASSRLSAEEVRLYSRFPGRSITISPRVLVLQRATLSARPAHACSVSIDVCARRLRSAAHACPSKQASRSLGDGHRRDKSRVHMTGLQMSLGNVTAAQARTSTELRISASRIHTSQESNMNIKH